MRACVVGALATALVTPLPVPASAAGRHMAHSDSGSEQLWLLAGVALTMAAIGAIALAAVRSRRDL